MAKIKKFSINKEKRPKKIDSDLSKFLYLTALKINELIEQTNQHDTEIEQLKKQFTDLIVKLQAFGTLPLEKYNKPGVDELSPGPQQTSRKESAKVQKLKKKDPF